MRRTMIFLTEFQTKLKQQLDTLEKLLFATVMHKSLTADECRCIEASVDLINFIRKECL